MTIVRLQTRLILHIVVGKYQIRSGTTPLMTLKQPKERLSQQAGSNSKKRKHLNRADRRVQVSYCGNSSRELNSQT
jgi:hypothetical protein